MFSATVSAKSSEYDYDLILIGGGSGGLACAKAAAELGARVALFDFVKPSPHGTKWGLGGTCVNVGCIPKKLMHQTALLGAGLEDAKTFGWQGIGEQPKLNWETMIQSVNNYVKSLNWGYRVQLKEKQVQFYKALASFVDPHTVEFEERKKGKQKITGKYIVIATGGRPNILNIPGKELGITSDDIFWKKENPGKTLCVGASYISLETAGFLHEFGLETHVMVRSILLRGFDRECAEAIGDFMDASGCVFKYNSSPTKLERTDDNRVLVTYKQAGVEKTEVYDTVLFATGRYADTAGLNLEAAGVVTARNGKFDTVQEATNVPHIFAIGDVCNGKQELTPVAIQAGSLLAKRLFAGSKAQMDYDRVSTTVFTPLEYGSCGLGEEEARERYGANVEVYLKKFVGLEQAGAHRYPISLNPTEDFNMPKRETPRPAAIENPHLSKLVVNTQEDERVVGFHYLGPNAGEVTQGFALAMKLGATKADFDTVVGIHPTTAENFTTLDITKSSGKNAEADGC